MSQVDVDVEILSELNKALQDKLSEYKNKNFLVLYNYTRLSKSVSGKAHDIRLRLVIDPETKKSVVQFGYITGFKQERKFVTVNGILEILEQWSAKSDLFGYDLKPVKKEGTPDFHITVDAQNNMIHVQSFYFKWMVDVLDRIPLSDTTKRPKIDNPSNPLTPELWSRMKNNFRRISLNNYINMVTYLCGNMNDYKLTFYHHSGKYLPLMITGQMVYNPFLQFPDIAKIFKQTELYNVLQQNEAESRGKYYRFITQYELCKVLHIEKFIAFDTVFVLRWLAGNFDRNFESATTYRYETVNDMGEYTYITLEEFNDLDESKKLRYKQISTLEILCVRYCRAMKGKPALINEIMETAHL